MTSEDAIRARIEQYLARVFTDYQRRLVYHRQAKIMRDAIWGFNSYEPYELALIDSPVFQRLRGIFQTSLALYTYPCAVHSRYEHSLGAAAVAARMLAAIDERMGRIVTPTMRIETRLGTLLHDLGHGPLSHSSEKFYETLTDRQGDPIFKRELGPNSLQAQNRIFSAANAGEILTYLMITTQSFKDLWNQIVSMYGANTPGLSAVDLERVARMILGVDEGIGGDVRFYRQIVNGPFDADKLDYLPRDGYFTGLNIVVDIERLLKTLTVVAEDGINDLGVVISGASVLEQIIFSKAQIYASMYNHHKVRAAHQLFQRLLRTMKERNYRPLDRDLNDPVSYIVLDDYDMLHSGHRDSDVNAIVTMIKNRILPKRALVIAYPCFEAGDQESRTNFFTRLAKGDNLEKIEREIEMALSLPKGEVTFDLPDPPRLSGTASATVRVAGNHTLLLRDLYPAGAWADAYEGFRKVAYVFTMAVDRRRVGNAVRESLRNHQSYPVKLNENSLALANL